jgi:predicted Ser/Thr protein kinase
MFVVFEKEIGAGSFGSVYKCRYSGLTVAVKKIPRKFSKNHEFEHEVQMLKYSNF